MLINVLTGLVLFADSEIDWGHMNMDGGWWLVMMIGMLLFWALVLVGIVWVVRELSGSRPRQGGDQPDALAVLDRRLAEGAISPEDYHERRAILTGTKAEDA